MPFPGPWCTPSPDGRWSAAWPRLTAHDLRTWGLGRHRSVDDYPYGGGPGMILRPEPVAGALDALRRPESTVILMDPGGEPFRQARAQDLARALAPGHRLPTLRGRRRARPLPRRPRALDRRLRPLGRRAAGPRRHRRRPAPAAGRHRRRLDRRRVLQPRRSSSTRSTRARPRSVGRACPRSCSAATTARSIDGVASRRWNGPDAGARTCSTAGRRLSQAGRQGSGRAGAACYTAASPRALDACRPDPVRSDPSVSSAL